MGLVNHRGGTQRVTAALGMQPSPGQAVQFAVNDGHQFVESARISTSPTLEKRGYGLGVRWHACPGKSSGRMAEARYPCREVISRSGVQGAVTAYLSTLS